MALLAHSAFSKNFLKHSDSATYAKYKILLREYILLLRDPRNGIHFVCCPEGGQFNKIACIPIVDFHSKPIATKGRLVVFHQCIWFYWFLQSAIHGADF